MRRSSRLRNSFMEKATKRRKPGKPKKPCGISFSVDITKVFPAWTANPPRDGVTITRVEERPLAQPDLTILDEARNLVTGSRQSDYGTPFENYRNVAAMWSVIAKVSLTPEQCCLMMAALKICRELNKSKRDNLVDGAGYFYMIDLIRQERAKKV